MKHNSGVSMIMLVIVIIIIIILSAVAISSGRNTAREAVITKKYDEICSVKDIVDETKRLIQLDPETYSEEYFWGKTVNELAEMLTSGNTEEIASYEAKEDIFENFGNRIGELSTTYQNGKIWYFLTNETIGADGTINYRELYSANKRHLEITNLSSEYIINYTDGKVYLLDGLEITKDNGIKEKLYEYEQISNIYNNVYKE